MDTTVFIASIWGPILIAVGAGVFSSRSYYTKIYRDLEKDALAVLVFGIAAMAVGIVQISMHNVYDSVPQIIVSLLGWGAFIKGAMFVVAPRAVDHMGDAWINSKLLPIVGALTLIAGGYLCWLGYLA